MTLLDIFLWSTLATSITVVWFFIVMWLAKITVGKDAKTSQIMGFLIAAGPVGWLVIVIIFVTDIINQLTNKNT